MTIFPYSSTAMPFGVVNAAYIARLPSPLNPVIELPATVIMIFVPARRTRILLLLVSEKYTFPGASTAIPEGRLRVASVPSPPSPLKLATPVPAIVEISFVPKVSLRMRWLLWSAMYTLPAESADMPDGALRRELVAGPRSPAKPATPLPAIVITVPVVFIIRTV